MQGKVVSVHGADAQWYEPTQIPQDKYLKIVQGRNLFLVTFITGSAVIWGLSLIPQWCMYRSVSWMYRKYCRGRVLDLTPKVADARDVRYYEMSNAVRVEFIVKERVDDDEYKTDLSLSEEEQTERRRALTLGFMLKNDYNWAGSSITFDTVERRETEMPDFRKYDTVVIRNELLNMGQEGARKMLNSAAAYVKEGGYVLLMDFGKPRWPLLASLTRWFGAATRSSMNLTHDYGRWVAEDNCYSIIAERRCLMGVHYAFVLQRKP
ncbi:uncharacterized protein TEOVI_000167800 [Trypanosoma equiperdum]|uniref:Methyltransferase type 11 domain-containing protein n=3 Tax=Trypanozoon TaxID=39700 RepID=Q38AD9_TRYB2|nr:hypothetical protein, conserved [Trypanosoma brucei brucei TREU927]EAN78231.1 hypothetical protein, conserved [Trypanosoma brucei brucei TREU927]RHW69236.1 hypothetical protein DPX39_100089900 [Trypanosoma brucei equiperdum]SCU70109.1 hypothetical protein, conserved [Trypanosoma equiperdum]